MRQTAVTSIEDGRERRVARAISARRRLDRAPFPVRDETEAEPRSGGRVWLNGVELGGTDRRHTTLAASHD